MDKASGAWAFSPRTWGGWLEVYVYLHIYFHHSIASAWEGSFWAYMYIESVKILVILNPTGYMLDIFWF